METTQDDLGEQERLRWASKDLTAQRGTQERFEQRPGA